MPQTLPAGIVACLSELADELGAWCVEGRDAALERHEQAVQERVWAVLPRWLGAVVEAATSGLDPRLLDASAACPGCGAKVAPHETERKRTVTTRCGKLRLARPWYHCVGCGHGWSVVETVLELAERSRLSAGLRAWLVLLGATTVVHEGATLLKTLTGLPVGRETLRRHSQQAGTALAVAEAAAISRVARTQEAAEPVDAAPGVLVVETDGAMVHFLDGWHEVKLGLVAGWDDGQLQAPSSVAAREPAQAFGARLAAAAARRGALEIVRWEGGLVGRGLAVLRETLLLGDGAPWIWHLADERVDARIEVVDYPHAAEHLHGVARALCGEGPPALAWAEARAGELLAQGVGPVLTALRLAKAPSADAREVLRRARGSFTTNAERLDYPSLRLDGLPIGSGGIESAADHVVQRRMKRAGMRWSDAGGAAMLALRARLRSNRPLIIPRQGVA